MSNIDNQIKILTDIYEKDFNKILSSYSNIYLKNDDIYNKVIDDFIEFIKNNMLLNHNYLILFKKLYYKVIYNNDFKIVNVDNNNINIELYNILENINDSNVYSVIEIDKTKYSNLFKLTNSKYFIYCKNFYYSKKDYEYAIFFEDNDKNNNLLSQYNYKNL